MNLKATCKYWRLSTLIFVLPLFLTTPVKPDIGGGSGRVKSPYSPGRPVLVAEITRVKKISARTRIVRDVPIEGTHVPGGGKDVGLIFLRGNNISGSPSFNITGKIEGGGSASVDFSEVESFSVIQRDLKSTGAGQVLIEIVLFPVIKADELVERRPTYSDLFEHNRTTLRLWVKVQSAGKDLCLVGKDETGRYRVISKLHKIALNTKVPLDYGTFVLGQLNLPAIWWAVESVTNDEKYPHRVFVRARAPRT